MMLRTIEDGKLFRRRADELLETKAAPFITACLQLKRGGIPKNKVSVEWKEGLADAALDAAGEEGE